MERAEAIKRMTAFIQIGKCHSTLWGKSIDVMQPGAIEDMASWFVEQAFQAGLFDEHHALHFLERTDGWTTQTGEFIYIQLAAQDELEAEIKYLEMYCVPCVADYVRFMGTEVCAEMTGDKLDFLTSMQRMPLYCAIKGRLPY